MLRSLCFGMLSTLAVTSLMACGDDTGAGGSGASAGSSQGGSSQGGSSQGGSSQGGSSQGGSSQGGSSQGGSSQGGSSQGGSSQGGAGGSAPAPAPECMQDSDCFTNSDCCECAAHPNGEEPAACAIDCIIDTCAAKGIDTTTAVCAAGRCVTTASCNDAVVTCDIPTPQCGAGESPIVVGSCYAGGCLPTLECRDVTSCASCTGPGDTCVIDAAHLQTIHCVDAQGCNPADCACLGDSVCIGSFNSCNDAVDHIECGCPTCLN
ncbi:MAG: hypothetical protein U0271_03870 [Polyangiaceae bacterium]